ncbi:hypothetical protein ColTof4_05172 [Colletotrichum tofieldiae]|nr:hypothetical protein ColTof3_10580 [Colletotrichum tofieldiae]GKT72749.1 hypothetical protein ColTof4_05172 [Colletotrichum tofieldiae]
MDASGTAFVSGTEFEYVCASWAAPYTKHSRPAATPQDCAQLCVDIPECLASTWQGNNCFMAGSKFQKLKENGQQGSFILLVKKQKTPDHTKGGSGQDSGTKAQCENEKDAIRREVTAKCENEKQALQTMGKNDLRQAEDRCSREKAVLDQEKNQCEAERTGYANQCSTAKSDLEQRLRQCEESGKDSGSTDSNTDNAGNTNSGNKDDIDNAEDVVAKYV